MAAGLVGVDYMTPRPMRRHNAIFVRRPICRFRRKKMGNMAHIRSVMMEQTVIETVSTTGNRLSTEPLLASLRYYDAHDLSI